jgi:hypothetical protein
MGEVDGGMRDAGCGGWDEEFGFEGCEFGSGSSRKTGLDMASVARKGLRGITQGVNSKLYRK